LARHQRYFPVATSAGDLLALFIVVANLESRQPDKVRDGNERVIRPRLADAAFFWDNDRKKSLASRLEELRDVVYQKGLGSLYDKCVRIASIVTWIAAQRGLDGASAERAAMLCKCDLLTGMVGEFPDLQGVMGRYYAGSDGEQPSVADAIGEHYRPRHAGDDLPATPAGRILALADKIDSLAGIFVIGKKPSGNRDPFGLRRAALAVIRIIIECGLDVDLKALLAEAVAVQPPGKTDAGELCDELYTFITDRLRRYLLDRDDNLATETFNAVLSRRPSSLVDFEQRLQAVQAFLELDAAASLAAANKRIANILRQAGEAGEYDQGGSNEVKKKLLSEPAEVALHEALGKAGEVVRPLLEARQYTDVLRTLAGLREPVDRFFDNVLVMADDDNIKKNRLALLGKLRALFLDVADISRLSAL
jgi:glycyl-tRNA synthetase beta chain